RSVDEVECSTRVRGGNCSRRCRSQPRQVEGKALGLIPIGRELEIVVINNGGAIEKSGDGALLGCSASTASRDGSGGVCVRYQVIAKGVVLRAFDKRIRGGGCARWFAVYTVAVARHFSFSTSITCYSAL